MCNRNPAKAVGLWEKYGSIDNGKYADCVIVDEDFNIRQIVKAWKDRFVELVNFIGTEKRGAWRLS